MSRLVLYILKGLLDSFGDSNDAPAPRPAPPQNPPPSMPTPPRHTVEARESRATPWDEMDGLAEALRAADLHSHDQLSGIPKDPGIYVWYFRALTGGLQTERCLRRGDWVLMYLGQARKNLRGRTNDHFNGDTIASGAIREVVGALLAKELELNQYRRGDDWTVDKAGDRRLTGWLHVNARVAFVSLQDATVPWPRSEGESDEELIARCEQALINRHFVLPLNRDQENKDICREAIEAWRRRRK